MVNEAEARNSTDEAGGGQATVRAPSCSRDPLRSLMVLKWLTRLFVYAGVTALIPLDHALSGLTWQQAISVHLGGYVIATIAIEELKRNTGRQFGPLVVAFLRMLAREGAPPPPLPTAAPGAALVGSRP